MKSCFGAAFVATFGWLTAVMPTPAEESRNRAVEQYLCKDMMRESGPNRDVAIAFLHGFLLGQSGSSQFNLDDLHRQTEAFVERCLSNPNEKAMQAMTEVKKK